MIDNTTKTTESEKTQNKPDCTTKTGRIKSSIKQVGLVEGGRD